MDELASYLAAYRSGGELKWAVSTALSSVYDTGECGLFDQTAEQFVEGAYGFIVFAFKEEGLKPPTKAKLIKAVRKAQEEGAIDWIFDDVLEGGDPRCRMTRLRPMSWLPRISLGLTIAQLSERLRCAECGGQVDSVKP